MTTLEPTFDGELAEADDATIAAAVEHAEVLPLLTALAAALDDPRLVPEHLQPDYTNPMDPNAGLSDEAIAEARALAREGLARLRDEGRTEPRPPTDAELARSAGFMAAGEPVDHLLELLREELALAEDRRAPRWHKDQVAPERTFRVAVIGAGMSGIAAAHRLLQAGIDVTVLEKDPEVGGTWYENRYPGCRVDVNNHFYSYSFAQRPDWPEHFSSQPVLLEYFRGVADRCGVTPHVRFDTEVTALELDERTWTWTVHLRTAHGEETIEAEAVVSATGQLNRPNIPEIPGADDFAGPAFHSARWDPQVDVAGKRVAVIGTGASAGQLVPKVALQAEHLDVYQRTPAWFLPTENYQDPVAPEALWLFRAVPGYASWYRLWIFWRLVEGLLVAAEVDPEWDAGGRSVSPMNELVRQLLEAYLKEQLAERPDLLEQVIPDYPPFAKRFIRDDGAWARTIQRDDVDLITEPIDRITPDGVRTADGVEHPADVLVWGTGFTASEFLMPMRVVGRGGVELHDRWAGDARAHLGITLPGYPNLFLLYGPNTNIVVNGSITFFSECEVTYLLSCIHELLERGARALEPTEEAHAASNAHVDEGNLRRAWGVSSVNSWYKNATGRSAQNWPFSLSEYWERTREVDLDEYEVHG